MGDQKPTAENVKRARSWMKRTTSWPDPTFEQSLAAEFAASDAIARRRALEEAILVVSLRSDPYAAEQDRVDSYDAMMAALSRLACSPPADGGGE